MNSFGVSCENSQHKGDWRMDIENQGGHGQTSFTCKRVSVCVCIFLAAVLSCVRAGSTGAEISKGISQVRKQH